MALSQKQKKEIESLLEKTIRSKLKKYTRESKSMPFLSLLVQDDEAVAAYSFLQSIATTLGMSLYEQISVIIASAHSSECDRNVKLNGTLSPARKAVIATITNGLRERTRRPSINREMREVLKASKAHGKTQKDGNIADFYMKKNGVEHYFEIKTVKPNIDVFAKSKTKLLEWVARKDKKIKPFLAFPYNPYAPQPYTRFTVQNMMDAKKDFLVGKEYWDMIGGRGTYEDLLHCIEQAGKKLHSEIRQKIKEVAKEKISKT